MYCAKSYDKVQVWWDRNSFSMSKNGIAFYIRYIGKNEPVGLASIISGEVRPLLANPETLVSYSKVTIPYGQNLFFEPIPFEMLKTYETKPQVLV